MSKSFLQSHFFPPLFSLPGYSFVNCRNLSSSSSRENHFVVLISVAVFVCTLKKKKIYIFLKEKCTQICALARCTVIFSSGKAGLNNGTGNNGNF